ncbi:MAG: ATP phosphoribosyltransferase regulatory subunit [Candidatus Symbiodolus clandestinus]
MKKRSNLPRGMNDRHAQEWYGYRRLQEDWHQITHLYGYQTVKISPVGFADTFTYQNNASLRRIYQFHDQKNRLLALNSDSIPAMLRIYLSGNKCTVRNSFFCDIFRYARQPLRHFYFLGITEVFSSVDHAHELDVQICKRMLSISCDFLENKAPAFVSVNNIKFWKEFFSFFIPDNEHRIFLHKRLAKLSGLAAYTLLLDEFTDPSLKSFLALLYTQTSSCAAYKRIRYTLLGKCSHLIYLLDDIFQLSILFSGRKGITVQPDLFNFHAFEFHDGLMYEIVDSTKKIRFGDGGVYHQYASEFVGEKTLLYSSVIVPHRLLNNFKIYEAESTADVMICLEKGLLNHPVAEHLLQALRDKKIRVYDVLFSRPKSHYLELKRLSIPYLVFIRQKDIENNAIKVYSSNRGSLQSFNFLDLSKFLKSTVKNSQCQINWHTTSSSIFSGSIAGEE